MLVKIWNTSRLCRVFNCHIHIVLPILSLKDSIKQLSGVAGILPSVSKFKWVLDRSSSPHLVELFVSLLTKLQNFVSQEESGFIIETELLERWPNFLDE